MVSSNNAFERAVKQRWTRLARHNGRRAAAQLGRYATKGRLAGSYFYRGCAHER